MPKLLAIDRKLRTLSRRLVTDAGGAPCCCSPADTCPCDPSLRFAAFRAETCTNGRRGGVVLSGGARMAVVRLTWAIAWETFTRVPSPFYAQAEMGRSSGTAQWCVLHSTVGQNGLVWILSGATSASEYQSAGSGAGFPDVENVNYAGQDALLYPVPWTGRTNRGTWQTVVNRATLLSFSDLPRPVPPSFVEPDYGACQSDATFSAPGLTERLVRNYGGGVDGGFASDVLTYVDSRANQITRRSSTVEAGWSIRYLTCEIGGPDQLQREPGCSNCGDRSTLEPFA